MKYKRSTSSIEQVARTSVCSIEISPLWVAVIRRSYTVACQYGCVSRESHMTWWI